ncbi:hypothetical protein [Pedobacter sp. L105]|uniref:hypothetical protein n=1 Tax=Pedobacter sp. L105 TaxID=1641871 RepID=UPI00131DDF46|nr:hypothetical protein [Pedobacter sp. L105]
MADKNTTKKDQDLSPADIERMELLFKANEKVGKQLTISSETGSLEEIDELKAILAKDFENPEEKYNIYYNGIRRLLMDNLPKGSEFEEIRKIIYDEKNIFLNLGKRKSDNNGVRKSDGRMTYQPIMNDILDIIIGWVADSRNPFEIYKRFYELNEKNSYGHEEYDESTKAVAKAMLNIAK